MKKEFIRDLIINFIFASIVFNVFNLLGLFSTHLEIDYFTKKQFILEELILIILALVATAMAGMIARFIRKVFSKEFGVVFRRSIAWLMLFGIYLITQFIPVR